MNKKITGTLAGVLLSLLPIILWVLLYVFTDFIIGWAGALMGLLFIYPYKKINPDDKSMFPYILGGLLIIVNITIAEIVSMAIYSGMNGYTLGEVLEFEGVISGMAIDIIIGLVLSYVVFFAFVVSARKKDNLKDIRQRTDTATTSETNFFTPGEVKQENETAAESNIFEDNTDNKR